MVFFILGGMSMVDQVVPLTPVMNQSMSITLSIDNKNVTLGLTFIYNTPGGYWYMSITDDSGNMLLDGVPLVTGDYPAANILDQYSYLGIGSAYVVSTSANLDGIPSENNLGTDYYLVWSDTVS